jgi:hypothetical protein
MQSAGYKVLRGLAGGRDAFLRTAMAVSGTSAVFSYAGGSYAREAVGADGLVDVGYTDARHDLLVHNEMAYLRDFPSHIAFFAEKPAAAGGETLLCDGRRVWRDLSAAARATLGEGQQLTYSQIYGNGALRYASRNDYMALWQDVFGVDDKASAEARAASLGYAVAWSAEDEMEVTFTRPAVRGAASPLTAPPTATSTGAREGAPPCFFDQLVCCHSKNCSATTRDGRPHFHVTLADAGAPGGRREIPAGVVQEVEALTEEHTEEVALAKGDAVVVDNRLVKHGRRAYQGERSMVVALLSS